MANLNTATAEAAYLAVTLLRIQYLICVVYLFLNLVFCPNCTVKMMDY